jgi:hypothetical protein
MPEATVNIHISAEDIARLQDLPFEELRFFYAPTPPAVGGSVGGGDD